MNLHFQMNHLWLLLLAVMALAGLGMALGNRLRGTPIENKEDHHNPKVMLANLLPLLVLLLIGLFTPLATGPWLGAACLLLALSLFLYALAIHAFVKAGSALVTIGIYRFSRNPMYLAWFLALLSFALMVWQAEPRLGGLALAASLANLALMHWMVRGEEKFLLKKYGEIYAAYLQQAPRYLLF